MFNHQYSNFNVILDRVKRGRLYKEISKEAAMSYAVDCMRLISSEKLYESKHHFIDIDSYRGKLPVDMQYIIQTLRVHNSNYNFTGESYTYTDDCNNSYRFIPMRYNTDTFASSYHVTRSYDMSCYSDQTYVLNSNYIQTNFERGKVIMIYKGFVTDQDGMIMIPDNTSVQMAIEYFIKWKFLEDSGIDQPFVERAMNKAEQEYCWYVGQAHNSMQEMNIDEYESFANMMTKLYTRNDHHSTRLNELGMQQFLKIQP